VNPSLKERCLDVLHKVVLEYGTLPESYFQAGVTLRSDVPYASSGFADVWKGQQDWSQVCVKVFRIQAATNPEKIKRVRRSSLLR